MNRKRYAGFFVRANAFIIDNIILSIFGALFLYVMSLAGMLDLNAVSEIVNQYIENPTSTELVSKALEIPGMSAFFTIWSFVQAVYFIVFHAVWGATPGKKLLHIHVEMANGEKLSWAFSIFRFIASIVTQATLIFYGLGYLIVLIDPQKRALHDFIAQTRFIWISLSFRKLKHRSMVKLKFLVPKTPCLPSWQQHSSPMAFLKSQTFRT